MDFTAFTGAISATEIVAAIGAIALVKASPKIAAWGYGVVMGFLGRK